MKAITKRNGTILFPFWKTRPVGAYRRMTGNVVKMPVKPNRRAFQRKRGSE